MLRMTAPFTQRSLRKGSRDTVPCGCRAEPADFYRVSGHTGASPQKTPHKSKPTVCASTALRSDGDSRNPVPHLDDKRAGQSLSHAAHDSSLYTKEPWEKRLRNPLLSAHGAAFKPRLFVEGEGNTAQSGPLCVKGGSKGGDCQRIYPFECSETRYKNNPYFALCRLPTDIRNPSARHISGKITCSTFPSGS